MKKIIVYELILVLFLTLIAYLSTDNLYVMLFVFLTFLIYFLFILNMSIKKYLFASKRYQECYKFMNSFIFSLSATNSLQSSFEAAVKNPSDEFIKELEGIKQLDIIEKIKYLDRYFPFKTYLIFIDVMDIFNTQGGDILYMSKYLVNEARLNQDYIDICKNLAIKKVVELAILWCLTLSILIILRFGLATFFEQLSNQIFYPISICIFFLLVLIFFHFSIKTILKINVKGIIYHDKQNKR